MVMRIYERDRLTLSDEQLFLEGAPKIVLVRKIRSKSYGHSLSDTICHRSKHFSMVRSQLRSLDPCKGLEYYSPACSGVHLVLYCICTYTLVKRRKSTQLVILFAITVMFALTTADIAISFRLLLDDLPAVVKHEMDLLTALNRANPKTPLFITNK